MNDIKQPVNPDKKLWIDWQKELSFRIKRSPSDERDQLKFLMRRLDHLASRVAQCKYGKKDHDIREMAALTWAIDKLSVNINRKSSAANVG